LRRERRTADARFWNPILDVGGLLGLILMPSWWIGPAFHAYVIVN
jgi:hypothetical protein